MHVPKSFGHELIRRSQICSTRAPASIGTLMARLKACVKTYRKKATTCTAFWGYDVNVNVGDYILAATDTQSTEIVKQSNGDPPKKEIYLNAVKMYIIEKETPTEGLYCGQALKGYRCLQEIQKRIAHEKRMKLTRYLSRDDLVRICETYSSKLNPKHGCRFIIISWDHVKNRPFLFVTPSSKKRIFDANRGAVAIGSGKRYLASTCKAWATIGVGVKSVSIKFAKKIVKLGMVHACKEDDGTGGSVIIHSIYTGFRKFFTDYNAPWENLEKELKRQCNVSELNVVEQVQAQVDLVRVKAERTRLQQENIARNEALKKRAQEEGVGGKKFGKRKSFGVWGKKFGKRKS